MVQYVSSGYFWLFIPLILTAIYLWKFRKKKSATLRFSVVPLAKKQSPSWRARIHRLPMILKVFSAIFMIIALARPQATSDKKKQNVEGIDIILLVDLSPTMLIEDMEPHNRLEAAKEAQIEFVKNRTNDRIGVVAFGGEAYTAVPLTLDHRIVINKLKELEHSDRIRQGTAQGVAIATGVARLKDSKAKSRIMVFITDGENNTGFIDPETALDMAKGFGIKIYTIGVGSDGEKMLPTFVDTIYDTKIKKYRPMTSTFHEDAMKHIAKETGGRYWRSQNMNELREVYATIDRLERSKIEASSYTVYEELYPPYVKMALCFFAGAWVLGHSFLRKTIS